MRYLLVLLAMSTVCFAAEPKFKYGQCVKLSADYHGFYSFACKKARFQIDGYENGQYFTTTYYLDYRKGCPTGLNFEERSLVLTKCPEDF
jgi:hypothetical protein